MIIPICMKPMEDEFLYGWLLRIADANGFSFYPDPVYSFTYFYFYKGEVEIKKEGKSVLDQIFNLDEIEKRYANIKCFPSVEFIVNNMTVFGTFMPFISKEEQAQRAMVMFRERTGSVLDTKSLNRMVETLHVCPECMKDDSERCGEPYYHTWHQLPAVKMCPVHGRSLMKVKGPRKGILNGVELPELEKETLQFPVEFELKIARFMYDAYRGQKYGNIENVIDAVRRKMIDLGYSLKEYEKLAEDMTITGVSIGVDTGKWIKRFFKNKPISLKEKILFFTYIFENYAEFERYNRLEESSGREYRAQIEKNYDIISSSENILKVRCRSCGYVFHTLSYAVMCGFGCPECEKQLSAEQCLQKHLQCLGDGNYTLAGELHGSSVKIRHETCGYTISKRLRIIMYGQGVCRCERKLKEEELKKRVDGGLQRFELVSYKKRGNSYDVVIRDRICGKTFPADVNAFANNRYCRACDKSMPDKIRYSKKKMQDSERFRRRMELLAGDEYVLVGDYTKFNKLCAIKHINCGTVRKMTPGAFIRGSRCHLCYQHINTEELKTAVCECTDGKYEIVDIDRPWAYIKCPNGNIVKKEVIYLFAELERPSKSEFFEYRCKRAFRKENPNFQIYQDIKRACEKNGVWTVADYKTELEHFDMNSRISALCRWGLIEKVGRGKYIATKETEIKKF